MVQVLDTGIAHAEENMACDANLLADLDPFGQPILHFYRWEGLSASFGHFVRLEKLVNLDEAASHRVSFAKRPTGGGLVFHIWDFAFSFLMPASHNLFSQNPLDNYRFVNDLVLQAVAGTFSLQGTPFLTEENFIAPSVECSHFCMARPTQYDVVWQGMKIAGAAQRKTKKGYLHQGTISLAKPHLPLLQKILRSESAVLDAMAAYTFAPLGQYEKDSLLEEARQLLQQRLMEKFMEKL